MPCHVMSLGFCSPPGACCPSVGSKQHFPVELSPGLQMFIPTLLSQASPDQQAEWLPKALGLKLIGDVLALCGLEPGAANVQGRVSRSQFAHESY